ncbi:MAG: DUF3147 family protein [Methylacidiphilales bacterium]|nr:DUF3147 family protein [Candidatus Methylacidiphilales bacterium]
MNLLVKIIISALLIGAISEISRRNSTIAALLAALPLISILSMIWIYHDSHDTAQIAQFSWSVFWYVIPSLLLFVILPVLLTRGQMAFYPALLISAAVTVLGFLLLRAILVRFGIHI